MDQIPLSEPDLTGNESRYLQECVDSTFVSSVGPFVDKFEGMVAAAVGTRKAVATSSGTTGLHAALTAVGVGYSDLVILQSYTFIGSANAISHCGAAPWLLDIGPESWSLNHVQLRDVLASQTRCQDGECIHLETGRRVAAIMPVYTFGLPADIDPIIDVARAYGLPVVADAAAAIGATYKDKKIAGTGADLTVFSFNGNKTVTAGGGGAVTGSDEDLVQSIRHLTTTARAGPGYLHDKVGFNYRMTNLQAAVGCAQLERLDNMVEKKREIAKVYQSSLIDQEGLAVFPAPNWAEGSCWISGVLADSDQRADRLRECLRGAGFNAQPFWKPIHLQPPYAGAVATDLSNAEDLWYRIIPLPNSTNLNKSDQYRVIDTIRKIAT